jgi:IS5 family transposase
LYGIDSERKLEQEIKVNIAYRWYLGLDLEDRVPDHSTLSQNRRRRFKGNNIFEEIFLHVVRTCIDSGLVAGEAIAMDSTHVKAHADTGKQETVTVKVKPREYLKKIEAEVQEKESEMYKDKKRCGKKPAERLQIRERTESKSLTDPESGMLGRPGKPKGFHYLCHQSADVENGIVTDIHVTAGNRLDHECCVERVKIQLERELPIREFVADKAYDVVEVHHLLSEMGISVYTPESLVHGGNTRHAVSPNQFRFDKEKNIYYCPGGQILPFTYFRRNNNGSVFAEYVSSAPKCRECHLRLDCFTHTQKVRRIGRVYGTEYVEESRKLVGTERYYYLQRRRRVICEGNFANMKDNGNLRKTRKRGLENATEHCLLCAIALNLRKMVKLIGRNIPDFFINSYMFGLFEAIKNLRGNFLGFLPC